MIEINNLAVRFDEQVVLDNISLNLPRTGLVSIVGPSGCGKTTLFNAICGLIKFDGDINIDGIYINNLSKTKLNKFRLKNIGFVFQDFKLFNLDNVSHNVSFPMDVNTGITSYRNKRRVKDLLSLVALEDKERQNIKNLSGGEKQRVAIARALINDPKLILADEPTGALDEETASKIMSLLKKISENKLVIMVSHDKELVDKYSDMIIELNDGKISGICKKNESKSEENLYLIKEEGGKRKPSIPSLFLLRHTLSSIKERKWRSILINIVTSFALIGVGLAFSLSSTISSNIKEACTNLFNEKQIMVSKEKSNNVTTVTGSSYNELIDIKRQYPKYIDDVRVNYRVNFNYLFKNGQDFSIFTNETKIDLSYYSFKQINEYRLLDKDDKRILPSVPTSLEDDEVVITLSLGDIHNICYSLQIIRTVDSLLDYMKNNSLYLLVNTINNEWSYEDEHIFKIKGFILDYEPMIFHTNKLWNQKVLEDYMKIPSNTNLSSVDSKPWTIKKLYYLEMKEGSDKDEFLHLVRYDTKMERYLFDIATFEMFPLTIDEDIETKNINKVIVYKNTLDNLSPKLMNSILEHFPICDAPIVGSYGGYLIHTDALMMGFSSYTYFSNDRNKLEEILDTYSSLPTLGNQNLSLPKNIKVGHYSKSLQDGVTFKVLPDTISVGRKPNNLDEIVISKKLYDSFTDSTSRLTIGVTTKEEKVSQTKYLREFKYIDLNIVGIVDEDSYAIYHNVDWPIEFYQSRVGVSIFSLGINTLCFSFSKDTDIDKTISLLKRAYPSYTFTNPLSSINEGIDEVCHYLEVAMIIFSSISIVISIFLLSICNYLHALEIKNDIGLSRCIGVDEFESVKFVFSHSYLMGFFSLLTATFELVVSNYFISMMVSHHLEVPFMFSFNPISILYMTLLTLGISTFSSLVISFKVLHFSPLDSLKAV